MLSGDTRTISASATSSNANCGTLNNQALVSATNAFDSFSAVSSITVQCPVGGFGGIVDLPDIAQGRAAVGASGSSGLSSGGIAAIAGGLAGALLAVGAGGWYVRRRFVRR